MRFGINNPSFLQSAGNAVNTDPGTFYIEAIENDTTISFGYPTYTQISADDVDYSYATESMTINSGEKVYVKFDTITTIPMNPPFSTNKKFNVGGELPNVHAEFTEEGEFISVDLARLFMGSMVVDASKLVIKQNVNAQGLFHGCTSLVNAPKLPATTLSEECYQEMFYGCTSLVNAPKLPATILATRCYSDMFYGCTGLVNAPELPATALADGCYGGMFYDCTSLVNAPELPATALADGCYQGMFCGCTSLVNAPELPAEILKGYCYAEMFYGCTSLVNAPKLPATILADSCYASMFYDCTSLVNAPEELPATTLVDGNWDYGNQTGCYYRMFYGCTSLVNAPKLPAEILKDYCYAEMFCGCSNLRNVECLAVDISAEACLSYWLDGVSETGTFTKAAGVDWPTGDSGIPEGWTAQEYAGNDFEVGEL